MFLGIINLSGIISFLGLFFALIACVLSFNQNLKLALVFFMYAGLADLFDGLIARKIKRNDYEKAFGVQIDSIIDMASFGITPVIIFLNTGYNNIFFYIVFYLYCACAAMRLAYFNCGKIKTRGEIKYYTGLPVTYSALIFPIIALFLIFFPFKHQDIIIMASFFILSILFVLKIPVPKPRGVFYIIFPVVAILLTILLLK